MHLVCSGPFRFDYVQGRWVYHRTGQDLYRQLEKEMEGLTGRQLKLDARAEGE